MKVKMDQKTEYRLSLGAYRGHHAMSVGRLLHFWELPDKAHGFLSFRCYWRGR
jgi:hypothetical protein